jgi:hypothetical protein
MAPPAEDAAAAGPAQPPPPKPVAALGGRRAGPGGSSPPSSPKPPPRTLRPPPLSLAPSPARLAALIAAWAPTFRLHPADAYHPCSGPWFAARSALLDRGGAVLAPLGSAVTVKRAVEAAAVAARSDPVDPVGAARGVRLALDVTARHGQPLAELDAGVPVYVRAQLVLPPSSDGSSGTDPTGRPTLEISYICLYAYNGPYHPLGRALGPAIGAHDGDWERVTARVDAETGELLGVWFNAHRPRDGCWAGPGSVEVEEAVGGDKGSGRIVAYVARHGHGAYPAPGVYGRAFGLANDHTSAAGPAWRPRTAVLMAADAAEGPPFDRPAGSAPQLGVVPCRGCDAYFYTDADGASAAPPPRGRPMRPSGAAGRDVRVVPDADGVGAFPGMWGEILAPRSQGWWARAECPVSRSAVHRLFLEAWPEAE